MNEERIPNSDSNTDDGLESPSRRKAVKKIVGGATALAAFHSLPADWSKPIIEQVFLPAHAATSGILILDPCEVTVGLPGGSANILVTAFINQAIANLPAVISGTVTLDDGTTITLPPISTKTDANGRFGGYWSIPQTNVRRVDITTKVEGAANEGRCFWEKPAEVPPATTVPPE